MQETTTATGLAGMRRAKSVILRERLRGRRLLLEMWRRRYLYLLALPGLCFLVLFRYVPMPGIVIAFQDYSVVKGFMRSPWVGLKHFERLFSQPAFWRILRNTVSISVLSLVLLFPAPIILALMLNEVRSQLYKRTMQTIYYLPHFFSWVIVASLTYFLLSVDVGVINRLIVMLGGEPILFMMKSKYFYPILLGQSLWKGVGWGTIVYLAAIAGVDPALYEAAKVDGAGRFRQIWHVTLPCILPTVLILFLLSLGGLLSTNFTQVWLMQNALVMDVGEVITTYVFKTGVRGGQFSYSTAVGLFQSVVGTGMIVGANQVAKKLGHEGIW